MGQGLRNVAHMTNAAVSIGDGIVPDFDLADRLEKARRVAGLSQLQLAEAIDISRRSVGLYECGHLEPKRHVILAWALVTGVSGHWLLTGRQPRANENSFDTLIHIPGRAAAS